MLRMNDDNVSHYSKETNAEKSAGLVVHLYRIVPHIHSTVFPLCICIKNPQMLTRLLRLKKSSSWLSIAVLTAASS